MKTRKQKYGNANLIGKNVEAIRKSRGISQKDFIAKMQLLGCDINPTSYSKLEGQVRNATDKEVFIIAKALDVKMEELFWCVYLSPDMSPTRHSLPLPSILLLWLQKEKPPWGTCDKAGAPSFSYNN